MKRFVYGSVFACMLLVFVAVTNSNGAVQSLHRSASQPAVVPSFEKVWRVHGASKLFAEIRSYELEFDKITWVSESEFFERKASVSVADDEFVRVLADTRGQRIESSVLAHDGSFHETVSLNREGRTQVNEAHSGEEARSQAVAFSIQICGLIPILRMCSQPDIEITFIERTPALLDKFRVRSHTCEFWLYVDQSHLIRRVDIRRVTLLFAGYQNVNGLILPQLERVSLDGRVVQELFFTRIDL